VTDWGDELRRLGRKVKPAAQLIGALLEVGLGLMFAVIAGAVLIWPPDRKPETPLIAVAILAGGAGFAFWQFRKELLPLLRTGQLGAALRSLRPNHVVAALLALAGAGVIAAVWWRSGVAPPPFFVRLPAEPGYEYRYNYPYPTLYRAGYIILAAGFCVIS
jgi:hypothetical protein